MSAVPPLSELSSVLTLPKSRRAHSPGKQRPCHEKEPMPGIAKNGDSNKRPQRACRAAPQLCIPTARWSLPLPLDRASQAPRLIFPRALSSTTPEGPMAACACCFTTGLVWLHPSRADWPPSYSYRGRIGSLALRLACSPPESASPLCSRTRAGGAPSSPQGRFRFGLHRTERFRHALENVFRWPSELLNPAGV